MKFIIERKRRIAGHWIQSVSFPGKYTMDEAQGLIDRYPYMNYRITPVPKTPYRRHAAITPLELRGAKAMLGSTRRYMCKQYTWDESKDAWEILMDAFVAVTRQLESL